MPLLQEPEPSSWNRDGDGTPVSYQSPSGLPSSQALLGEDQVGGHLDSKSDSPEVGLEVPRSELSDKEDSALEMSLRHFFPLPNLCIVSSRSRCAADRRAAPQCRGTFPGRVRLG